MNANEIADGLAKMYIEKDVNGLFNKRIQNMLRQQQQLIENLNGRIERMIENQSHHEGIAHAGGYETGYEAGRKMGMKQERALWELAASTQELEK
jgi:hypothetical protein